MESCWETGGPEWLIAAIPWAALAAIAAFLMWLPDRAHEPTVDSRSRRVMPKVQLLASVVLALIVAGWLAPDGWADFAWDAAGGVVVIAGIAFVADHAPRRGRKFLLATWVGGAGAALGGLVATLYLGHPC